MDRATALYRRYFTESEVEAEDAHNRREERLASIAEWLSRSFHAEFVRLLLEIRKTNEPRPGQQDEMVYKIGVRDGVDLVLDLLSRLEAEIKESRDAG